MLYGEYFNGVAEVIKTNAIVADAQAELWRFYILKTLDVSLASCKITR